MTDRWSGKSRQLISLPLLSTVKTPDSFSLLSSSFYLLCISACTDVTTLRFTVPTLACSALVVTIFARQSVASQNGSFKDPLRSNRQRGGHVPGIGELHDLLCSET
jgi:hypothetical protein